MIRIRVTGTGWSGGPSLNTFYFTSPTEDSAAVDECVVRVRAGWLAMAANIPGSVIHNVVPEVDIVDPVTGNITNTIPATTPGAPLVGAAPNTFLPLATAACLTYSTGTFIAGRRVRGRAFISPLTAFTAEANGTPASDLIVAMQAMGTALMGVAATSPLVVWHRPKEGGTPGSTALVLSTSVKDSFAVLRSRRD